MPFTTILGKLLEGFLSTFSIFVLTLVFSLPLGWLVYFGRKSRLKIVSGIFRVYISIMRGTPLMLQLIIWYFGPFYLFHATLAGYKFPAIILAFSVNYAAYFAEIYRSGMEAIDPGQYEAAKVLGYSRAQTFFRIVFPQVIRVILPSVGNEVITLVKDTSLAYSVSYVEMFAIAKQIAAAETTILPLVAAGVFYYIFNFLVEQGLSFSERRLNYYKV